MLDAIPMNQSTVITFKEAYYINVPMRRGSCYPHSYKIIISKDHDTERLMQVLLFFNIHGEALNQPDEFFFPLGHILILSEQELSLKFPTGWPIRCPNCEWWNFSYVSERSGNIRRYTCKKCHSIFLATWKGTPVSSVFSEPQNTKMEDWDWAKVCQPMIEQGTDQRKLT